VLNAGAAPTEGSAERLERLVTRLREQGYRLTPQRRAVLRVLAESREHPSAEQVYARLRDEFPGISLGTIYKTAALLRDQGELYEIAFSDGGSRFDVREPKPHPHLVCVRCRSVTDLDLPCAQPDWADVARLTGYQIVSQRLDFFGICPRCQGQPGADEREEGTAHTPAGR